MVRQVVERAVQELIHPVMERSIKIAVTTAEIIVKKVINLIVPLSEISKKQNFIVQDSTELEFVED